MKRWIDSVLNGVTMYRLIIYYLAGLLLVALGMSVVGVLPYNAFAIMASVAFLIAVCWFINRVFAWAFDAPANVESAYITALILALIIEPIQSWNDLWFLGWVAVLAMASKYILAINRKHIFNPAAFALVALAIVTNQTGVWWVATAWLLPFVVAGGWLIAYKIQRTGMVLIFMGTALFFSLAISVFTGENLATATGDFWLRSPTAFFGFVFVTEPMSTPPTATLRTIYAALVGALFTPQAHVGMLYITPEIAICLGNVFSWLVSPKSRTLLQLREKRQIGSDVWEFFFAPSQRLDFAPGQYMEWTLPHHNPDSRGARRYFTLASAPSEKLVRVGVKFYPHSSTFKKALLNMRIGGEIVAGQLGGDFTMPRNPRTPLVFIAGGIGITPFRSMLQHLLDRKQRRPVTVLAVNKTAHDIVYQDVLNRAADELGVRVVYALTSRDGTSPGKRARVGRVDIRMIREEVPHYLNSLFYISGPNAMVDATQSLLRSIGVPKSQIHIDYFPGWLQVAGR